MHKYLIFIFGLFSFQLVNGQSDSLIERSYTLESTKVSLVEAKREIQEKAFLQAIEELALETLGETRYSKKKNQINNLLLSKASRFIPFTKIVDSAQKDNVLKQTINMKLNVSDFRAILKSMGQLEEIDKNQSVLSFLSFENEVTQTKFNWWSPEDSPQKSLSMQLEARLFEIWIKNGLYLITMNRFHGSDSLPSWGRKTFLTPEEQQKLALSYQAPYLMTGKILIQRSERHVNSVRLDVVINLVQSENLRLLSNIKRVYEMPLPKDSKKLDSDIEKKLGDEMESLGLEIANLMSETIQRGLLQTQKLSLGFNMAGSPQKIEWLKNKVRTSISSIKNIRERSVSASQVVFEVDYLGSVKDIQDKVIAMDVKSAAWNQIELKSSNSNSVIFDIK